MSQKLLPLNPRQMVGLADGNSFYCSCEESVQPWLYGKPIIVASNNDGCAIAMNRLAEKYVKMGDAMFQITDTIREHGIVTFSSNYELYGDLSNRMHSIFSSYTPNYERYSIDEGFLDFTGMEGFDFEKLGRDIIRSTRRGIGIPICLGIAPTKVLAKAANKLAKTDDARRGLYIIDTEEKRVEALKKLPIGDVWGIGRRHEKRLTAMGIRTAYDFSVLPREWVRKNMTVVCDRLWREMNGTPCISLELAPPDKQEICTSRAFGKMTSDFNEVKAAVVRYLSSSARKLRDQHSYARRIYVGIETNPFNEYQRQTYRGLQIEFPVPTDNTFEMIPYAMTLLKAIWPTYSLGERPFLFKRATVTLSDLIPAEAMQLNMFHQEPNIEQLRRLQAAVDEANGPLNLDSRLVVLGAELTGQNNTRLRREMLSKCPTTKWSDRIDIAI